MKYVLVAAIAFTFAACGSYNVEPIKSCADAIGPIHEGDHGYNSWLDLDDDGVICEV